jgi:hypothetical protein
MLRSVDSFSPNWTRATAATYLREHGFRSDTVELLLAYKEPNQMKASYHHREPGTERRRALQYWADQLDLLAAAEKSQLAA